MSSPVSQSDLAYLRGLEDSLLHDECIISEYLHTPDAMGGYADNWLSRETPVPCFLEQLPEREGRGRSREAAGQIIGRGAYILNLKYDEDIGQLDKVLFTQGQAAGREFIVISDFWADKGTWQELRRVLVEEAAFVDRETIVALATEMDDYVATEDDEVLVETE